MFSIRFNWLPLWHEIICGFFGVTFIEFMFDTTQKVKSILCQQNEKLFGVLNLLLSSDHYLQVAILWNVLIT